MGQDAPIIHEIRRRSRLSLRRVPVGTARAAPLHFLITGPHEPAPITARLDPGEGGTLLRMRMVTLALPVLLLLIGVLPALGQDDEPLAPPLAGSRTAISC